MISSNQMIQSYDQPIISASPKTRKHCAEEINRAMTRFPMILQILRQFSRSSLPFPGDGEIRHGCERALTGILAALASIEIAPSDIRSNAEETALSWLSDPISNRLIDPDKLDRMQQFIDCILNSTHA